MLASMASFTLPNPALVRTVRLRRPAAQLSRWADSQRDATAIARALSDLVLGNTMNRQLRST